MLELVLIRHGETAWNAGRIFRGQKKCRAATAATSRHRCLTDYLGNEYIETHYTSPLQRAVATAAPLAERLGLEPVVSNNLTDIDFGEWQGLAAAEVKSRYPALPVSGWKADGPY